MKKSVGRILDGMWENTIIPGVKFLRPIVHEDARGIFAKCFHAGDFRVQGMEYTWQESYYSISRKNVIRGMHFQAPPSHYAKLVTVLAGQVRDLVLDLRRNSPTYGRHLAMELSERDRILLYLPKGVAHGFGVLSDSATMLYWVTSIYSLEHDAGIRWDSFGAEWGILNPILSERDRALPSLAGYQSPFVYQEPAV